MTQEEKDLLLKDLCCRLPYRVICKDDYVEIEGKLSQIGINYDMCLLSDAYGKTSWAYIPNCKPYLFPLSSMSEEQKQEYQYITERWMYDSSYSIGDSIDWLNENHFDYRGLIGKSLALDATGLNIY